MKTFSRLYKSIYTSSDQSFRSNLIREYLIQAEPDSILLSLDLLTGKTLPPLVSSKSLLKITQRYKDFPDWLMIECHKQANDWVETCTLMVQDPDVKTSTINLTAWAHEYRNTLAHKEDNTQIEEYIFRHWSGLSLQELWLFNKLITGTLKSMIAKKEIAHIISSIWNVSPELINLRLCLYTADEMSFDQFISKESNLLEAQFEPSPFVNPADWNKQLLSEDPQDYFLEAFVHGERQQLIKKSGKVLSFSLNQEWGIVKPGKTNNWIRYLPEGSTLEIVSNGSQILLLDIYTWANDPICFESLEKKKKWLMAWSDKWSDRFPFMLAPYFELTDWEDALLFPSTTGFIVKHKTNVSSWYRFKPVPLVLWTVLLYAESGRQGTMDFQMTLAIASKEGNLVPITKIHSTELSPPDNTSLYYWIQNNTLQRFGPVKTLRSTQFFKISFDRLQISKKVKAGIKLINVKIIYWSKDNNMKVKVSSIADLTDLIQ